MKGFPFGWSTTTGVTDNNELASLAQQLNQLRKPEVTVDDVMAAKMAWFDFPHHWPGREPKTG